MSFEAHAKSFYLNFSTRPTVNKKKVQNVNLKKWETSLRDFNENSVQPLSFASSEPNTIYKEFNKKCNKIQRKTQSDNVKPLNWKSEISSLDTSLDNQPNTFYAISFDQSPQKEKKTCQLKDVNFNVCDIKATFEKKALGIQRANIMHINSKHKPYKYSENRHKLLKRKSISEQNNIETDISCINSPTRPFPLTQSTDKKKKSHLLKNTNFNFCDIQASFQEKTSEDICEQTFNSKPNQCDVLKKISSAKESILKDKSILSQEISHSVAVVVPKNSSVVNNLPIKYCPQSDGNFNNKSTEIKQCAKLGKVRDIKESILKYSFNTSKKLSNNNISSVLSKSDIYLNAFIESDLRMNGGFEDTRCKLTKLEKDVKKSLLKPSFVLPEEFSENSYVSTLPKIPIALATVTIENADIFKGVKHEADQQEFNKCLLKNDLLSVGNFKCSGASIGVGSNWVHSLQQVNEEHSNLEGKRKIQNLLVGGYCEQILKFQRWELSEKAIYVHRNGSKNTLGCLVMRVNSLIQQHEFVITECYLLNKSAVPEEHGILESFFLNEGQTYIALFQKSSFLKQQMKIGKIFVLSLPWHLIQLKPFKCPVIICKYFKEVGMEHIHQGLSINEMLREKAPKFKPPEQKQCNLPNCSYQRGTLEEEEIFFMSKKRLNISARIQRIWNHRISMQKLPIFVNNQNISRLTLLLQMKKGDFCQLSTSSCHNLCFLEWLKFLLEEKGQCYLFKNVKVLHRLEKRRFPKLFKYLQSLLKENKVTRMEQNYVYQLGIDEMTKKPSKISEADMPPLLTVIYLPLSVLLLRNSHHARVSCSAKVLLHHCSILYITDKSLLQLKSIPYMKVFLHEFTASFSNSIIDIKEALVFEGSLHLDEYSEISISPLSSNLSILHLKDVELPLKQDSNVDDIITVKGNVINVNEKSACIWLQCSFCMNENLVQNSEEVIFCEDCFLVVNQPHLKVKMNVTIVSETLTNILFNIELLSSTIKSILSLKENSYQPQCNVSDVLGQEIGPLLCYIKGVESTDDDHKVFYLNEIDG